MGPLDGNRGGRSKQDSLHKLGQMLRSFAMPPHDDDEFTFEPFPELDSLQVLLLTMHSESAVESMTCTRRFSASR